MNNNELLSRIRRGVKHPSRVLSFLRRNFSRYTWSFWESLGFHLVPDNFYYPIPNLRNLRKKDWKKPFPEEGIDMNKSYQIDLIKEFNKYSSEFANLEETGPGPKGDSATYYSIIRELEPETIIEVGAGNSTNTALHASKKNKCECEIIAIDPFPDDYLKKYISKKGVNIIESRAERIDPEWYCGKLGYGDILFIDSSHVVEVGSEVVHLLLRVIPNIPSGVYIHFHDVKIPYEYSEQRVTEELTFWNERYLLHSFLLFNNDFEIVYASRYLYENEKEEMISNIPGYKETDSHGGSFWIRRK